MDIYAHGDELAQVMGRDRDEQGKRIHTLPEEEKILVSTIKNPVLVTDNYRMSLLDPVVRDTIFGLYEKPIRVTEYDGTSIRFVEGKYEGVWGPSIDTILFCKALSEIDLAGVETAAEIGCGSGFVTKHLVRKAKNLKKISLIDFDQKAVECAMNEVKFPDRVFSAGDGIDFLKGGRRYDLLMSNPPYIPRPGSIDDNPYEGVELLNYLISHANEHLTNKGKLIVNMSSLCEHIAKKTIDESDVTVRNLANMEVPLKVYNVLNNPEWMKYLLGNGLDEELKDGYKYWHTINILEVSV